MIRLDGAWEPENYIGPRIEIKGGTLTKLWRGSPVLTTRFSAEETPDGVLLRLQKTDLRYAGDDSPYASVKECRYADGAVTMTEVFPITGESVDVYRRTENSRYGSVTLVDRRAFLRGTWREAGGKQTLVFRGDRLGFAFEDGKPDRWVRFCTVRDNGDPDPDGFRVIDRDPGREGIGFFGELRRQGNALCARIPVCDAPQVCLTFEKIR